MISEESARPVLRLVHSRCEQLEFDFDTPKAVQRMLKRPSGHTELDRERLLTAPRAPASARAPLARLVRELNVHLVGSPVLSVLTRTPFVLDRQPYIVRVPIAAVARRDAPTFSGIVDEAPLIAIEAIAARERRLDQGRRIEQYLAGGTRVVWIIDVSASCVHIFHAGRRGHVVSREGVLQAWKILPEFSCPLDVVFKRRGPRAASEVAAPTPGLAGPGSSGFSYLMDEDAFEVDMPEDESLEDCVDLDEAYPL